MLTGVLLGFGAFLIGYLFGAWQGYEVGRWTADQLARRQP